MASAAVRSPAATAEQEVKTGLSKVWADMREGTSFVVHHAALLFVITAMGAAMFVLGCFAPLIAVYVRDILHAGQGTFGITSAMIGIGMLSGMNLLTSVAKRVQNKLLVYSGRHKCSPTGNAANHAWPRRLDRHVAHFSAQIAGLLLSGVLAKSHQRSASLRDVRHHGCLAADRSKLWMEPEKQSVIA